MKPQKSQTPATRTQAPKNPTRSTKAKPQRTTKPKSDTLQVISNAAKIPQFPPADVKRLMDKLDMNEKAFALVMNVSPMTVRYWSAGAVKPCGLSRRLMQILDATPEIAGDVLAGRK